ncbi:MAG TPA: hypothetical protein VFB74_34020 [Kribbellaceae bacterium]|nr:hypothetical protein [Kribbellaceae bacterium]
MKLIRDNLADAPWEFLPEGKRFVRPINDRAEHLSLLRRKILEEAGELFEADSPNARAREAGDILQALEDYLSLSGTDIFEALEAKQRKYEQRGGFRKGTVWDI